MKKRALALILCIMMIFNLTTAFANSEGEVASKDIKLTLTDEDAQKMEISIEPENIAKEISGVKTDTVFEHKKIDSKGGIGWIKGKTYCVSDGKLYIDPIRDKHTLTLKLNSGEELHFIRKDKNFKKIDLAHPPKGKLHIKLEGYFEGALVGQKKYDAVSAATGTTSDNKNSNIKVYGQITDENKGPIPGAWKELSKSDIEVDKGRTKIILDEKSGMKPSYNAGDSSITLAGEPKKVGDYPVRVELVDIYGRTASSNQAWFSVSDIETTYLDKVMKDVDTRLKTTANGKVLFNQEPWYIAYFNENNKGEGQEYTVPKNINLWQGSHESGTYGQLGLIFNLSDNPKREKFEYKPEEDRIPIQNFVLQEGSNLTLVNMKVFSGVNIIVNKGAILNIHDSSIYGKITVNGGRLRVNYDPDGKFQGKFGKPSDAKVVSGSSIQGQIILNDGAVLESSYIYSNTNNLTDTNMAVKNTRPVVLVKGKAFIRGNVFVKGDESPTGSESNGRPYRGQTGIEVDGGSLTILENSNLYTYGGGTSATTSRGGNALVLKNDGKILGDGGLVALGGTGHSGEGGYAVCGKGTISSKIAYLRAGNGSDVSPAKEDGVKITKNVIGKVEDGQKGSGKIAEEYPEFWGHSSVPKKLDDNKIGKDLINPSGEEGIKGEQAPIFEDAKPGQKIKRVEFKTNRFYQKSIQVAERSDDSKAWIEKLANGKGDVSLDSKKIVMLDNVVEGKKGYKVEGLFLYIYGLNVDDKVDIKVDGYVPVSLKAVASEDGKNMYRLEKFSKGPEEKPYIPEEELDTSDANVVRAKEYIENLNLDESALNQAGVNTERNSSTINDLTESLEKAKKLASKDNLSPEEKKELVLIHKNKFEDKTKNIRIDMKLEDSKVVANRHDNMRLHAKIKNDKVTYSSELASISKQTYPKLTVYRIDKAEYETDTVTGATPKFENNELDGKYYEINKVPENQVRSAQSSKYEISFKEAEIKKEFPNTHLLKIVFSVKLADDIFVKSTDYVFLSDTKAVEKEDNNENIVSEQDPTKENNKNEGPKDKNDQNKGHYEYISTRRLVPVKVKSSKKSVVKPYIEGYSDGLFRPNLAVTRAEAAQMILKLQKATASKNKLDFDDVKDAWYNEALNYTYSKGMILAKDGKLRPDDKMTRAEFARMIFPLLPKKSTEQAFKDIRGHEFEEAILRAAVNGIVKGYPDKTFRPDGKVTRAEAVAMLNRLYKKTLTADEIEKNMFKLKTFEDVKKSHWAYKEIMSAMNYEFVKSAGDDSYTYEMRYEEVWDKVWVEDSVKEEKKPEIKKEFTNETLTDENSKITLKGKLSKDAKLEIKDKSEAKAGKVQITVPESILKDYRNLKAEEGKAYEIIKSYDVKLIGDYQGKLQVSLAVGDEYNGKNAIIKHLSKDGLKSYKAVVTEGKVEVEVDGLSPFVVIIEKDKIDQEMLDLKLSLNKKLEDALKKDRLEFTKKSFDILEKEIEKAKALKDSEDKEAIKQEIASLEGAINGLQKLGDIDTLQKKVDNAWEKTKDESYTQESRENLKTFLGRFANNYDFDNATEEIVKKDLEAIAEELGKLVKKSVVEEVALEIDKTNGTVDQAKAVIGKTFKEATTSSGTYNFEEPSISGKKFIGWKINGEGETFTNEKLKNKTIEKGMVKESKIRLLAQFENETPPAVEKKNVKLTEEKKPKAIAIDKNDNDTLAWLSELKKQNGSISKYPSGEKMPMVSSSSGTFGYYVFSKSSLGIANAKVGDIFKVEVEGYKDIFLKAEPLGAIYHLVQIDNPQTQKEDPPKHQLKTVVFEDPEDRKIVLKKEHENSGIWLDTLKTEGKVEKLQGNTYVDFPKENLKFFNKSSRRSLTIFKLNKGDIVKISVEGFEDVYLQAEQFGSSYKLKQVKNPQVSGNEEDIPSQEPKPNQKPKIGTPLNRQLNILSNDSPDENTIKWYKKLYDEGKVLLNGVAMEKTGEFGTEMGYYLNPPAKAVRIKFKKLSKDDIITLKVPGWEDIRFKVVNLISYSGANGEKEAEFKELEPGEK
ncbi:S-layer homology domain-containing protein [Peptoniphilus asaccharolyticus]